MSIKEKASKESGGELQVPYDPDCRVCKKGGEVVGLVNSLLSSGASISEVLKVLEPLNQSWGLGGKIGEGSLKTHLKYHLPMRSEAVKELVRVRAQQYQEDMEKGIERELTPLKYAETMMGQAYKGLQNGAPVSPSEGLRAAEAVNDLMTDNSNQSLQGAFEQLQLIIEAVRRVVSPEQMRQIVDILQESKQDLTVPVGIQDSEVSEVTVV